ncbi:PAS domain-containing sensor histidine kinase [Edaphobacter aggregans]|uniref:sensor histidine kinase n=1 Tax=Edaphobacter aggregans TaxID=570835 RepID=UPI001B800CD4|nr:PAS domain-containing sensor histidine kinase [Edaphobacter aggregans]
MRKLTASKPRMLLLGISIVAILVLLEWRYDFDFSLGILYVFPVMIAGSVLTRPQIVVAAVFCAYTRGLFTADETQLEHTLRFVMATIAYTGCGLLIYQVTESRRVMLAHYARLRFEQSLRRNAQEQLRQLAESSPAAILTVGALGEILAANAAAEEIFAANGSGLTGRQVRDLVPMFDDALRLPEEISGIRTQAHTWARRADNSHFPAATWFSIYGKGEGRRLAAIVVDISDEVREREQAHYEDLVHQNRVFAGAVSHEIRNLCAAIAVVQQNLEKHTSLAGDDDFEAMRKLVSGLGHISTFDLRNQSRAQLAPVDLADLADELRVIIGQDWREAGGEVVWRIDPFFPLVQADRHGLLQIMLNLSQNALRAVEHSDRRQLIVEPRVEDAFAVVRISDTGHGVRNPSILFQAFRPGHDSGGSGLGLYVSRAMAKSFGGDLRYVLVEDGGCFEVVLRLATADVDDEVSVPS